MTPSKRTIANQQNAAKSTGPKTKIGKKNTSSNALKHGFYSSELMISEADKAEFESLRENLLDQLAPSTSLQTVAFEQIVSSCWRCKLAIRMEMLRLEAHFTKKEEPPSNENAPLTDARAIQWYGASKQDINRGIRMLEDLRADVASNGGIHLPHKKEEIVKAFGQGFYDALEDWKPMSIDAILLAEHAVQHEKTYGPSSSPPAPFQGEKVVADPKQKWQMLVKLVEMQMQHLVDLRHVSGQGAQVRDQLPTDFVPRYFASTSRDLQRSVDWYLYIKSKGL